MELSADQIQHNHERISVRVRDYAFNFYLDKTTPELMEYSTFELLHLLKYARSERADIYKLMDTFYKARTQLEIKDYKEEEEYSRKEYERITRKMFVVENLLRQRLGYVPSRITNDYLGQFLEDMKKGKQTPMVFGKQR